MFTMVVPALLVSIVKLFPCPCEAGTSHGHPLQLPASFPQDFPCEKLANMLITNGNPVTAECQGIIIKSQALGVQSCDHRL